MDDFHKRRAEYPEHVGQVSEVLERSDEFAMSVVLSETTTAVRVARYVVPKTSWDAWWVEARKAIRDYSVVAVASGTKELPAPHEERAISSEGVWNLAHVGDIPTARAFHSAVWTGSVMLVYGGTPSSNNGVTSTGGRYDPATDTWAQTATAGAPVPSYGQTAVWTGTEMIIWGGSGNSGGRYNPSTDTWAPTSINDAPALRWHHTAIWTGSRMIIWGGDWSNVLFNSGGVYDPATDTWTATSVDGAPAGRSWHTAVWTGTRMMIWGGQNARDPYQFRNDGGLYDPVTDRWSSTATVGAPSARSFHTAVWTGTRVVIWGGMNGSYPYQHLSDGGLYDPASDNWTATVATNAPSARSEHTSIWTGRAMLVWGGNTGVPANPTLANGGGAFDPAANVWTSISTLAAPAKREGHSAVWTGSLMLIWGGYAPEGLVNTGGRYDPAPDTWTPTSTGRAPAERFGHTAIWTGNVMVVWGGYEYLPQADHALNTGGRYDPVTDSWSAMSMAGAPGARYLHTAIWTGGSMVVWGGGAFESDVIGDGGLYDPVADTWKPTSNTGAPSGRRNHTAVWTGTLMVVWGGTDTASNFNTGGRYDPATDTWTPVSTAAAPSARSLHTAIWTGSRMVIWGGRYDYPRDGGQYDPIRDAWTPTSIVGAPTGRLSPVSVWTGAVMVVWGGRVFDFVAQQYVYQDTGGRYDPVTDSWMPTSMTDAPSARAEHTAIWTGAVMVVWGGDGGAPTFNTGGVYDPATDGWTPTSTAGAPTPRLGHSAVWTGDRMVVWGGFGDYAQPLNEGGQYFLSPAADCNDGNPCTDDSDDPVKGCIHTSNTAACDDGNACTTGDTCGGGACNPGTSVVCNDNNACTSDTCNPASGCVYTPMPGAMCDDGNACTKNDACTATGICAGGAALSCSDNNPCTDDACNPAIGCVHTNNINPCDDGNACTTGDTCGNGSCHGGPARTCDDGNACNGIETCNPLTGCVAGTPVVCTPLDQCHVVGVCDPAKGTCSNPPKPDGAACDDNSLCTTGETCQAGTCTATYSGLNHPTPRSSGYYHQLCEKAEHGQVPYHGDQITDTDAVCVASLTAEFSGFQTATDLCAMIDDDGAREKQHPGDDDPYSHECFKAEDEVIATALNICRARVCEAQNVDSRCGADDHEVIETSVGASFANANAIVDDPNRTKDQCKQASCELKEINNGHALEMNSVVLALEAQAVRLSWLAMDLEDGTDMPNKYEVWRRPLNSPSGFTKIGETTGLTFLDTSVRTSSWEYEVTADIP